MYLFSQLLCALVLPAGLTVLAVALLRSRSLIDGADCCFQRGLGGAVLAGMYLIGHVTSALAVDAKLVPPHLGWHWLPWAAGGLVVVSLSAAPPGALRWGLQAALAAVGAVLLLLPLASLAMWQIAAWAVACAASVLVTGLTAVRGSPTAQLGAGAIAAGAVAMGAMLSHSKDLALLAAILPPIVIATWLMWRTLPTWGGGTLALAHLLAWHVTLASTYSELPWWLAPGFAALLPVGALTGRLGRNPLQATLWQLAATALAAVLVLGATYVAMQPPADDSAGAANAYGY